MFRKGKGLLCVVAGNSELCAFDRHLDWQLKRCHSASICRPNGEDYTEMFMQISPFKCRKRKTKRFGKGKSVAPKLFNDFSWKCI